MAAYRGGGRRGAGSRDGSAVALRLVLLLLQQIARLERKPPVTIALVAVNVLFYLRPKELLGWDFLPDVGQACLQPRAILQGLQLPRLLWSAFLHADELHVFYNMSSFLFKGVQLEPALGSAPYAALCAELLLVSHSLVVLLAAALSALGPLGTPLGGASAYTGMCAIGFSAVLFGLKTVLMDGAPGWSTVAGLQVPSKYVSWAELLYIQFITPRASFLGHLSGILAGLLHIHVTRPLLRLAPVEGRLARSSPPGGSSAPRRGFRAAPSAGRGSSSSSSAWQRAQRGGWGSGGEGLWGWFSPWWAPDRGQARGEPRYARGDDWAGEPDAPADRVGRRRTVRRKESSRGGGAARVLRPEDLGPEPPAEGTRGQSSARELRPEDIALEPEPEPEAGAGLRPRRADTAPPGDSGFPVIPLRRGGARGQATLVEDSSRSGEEEEAAGHLPGGRARGAPSRRGRRRGGAGLGAGVGRERETLDPNNDPMLRPRGERLPRAPPWAKVADPWGRGGTLAALCALAVVSNPDRDHFVRFVEEYTSKGLGYLPGFAAASVVWLQSRAGLGFHLWNYRICSIARYGSFWFLGAFGTWLPLPWGWAAGAMGGLLRGTGAQLTWYGVALPELLELLTTALIGAWLLGQLLPHSGLARHLEVAPGDLKRRPWTFALAALHHDSLFELIGNIQMLLLVGPTLQAELGYAGFLTLYLLSGTLANLVTYIASSGSPGSATEGASAAIYALLACNVLIEPYRKFAWMFGIDLNAMGLLGAKLGLEYVARRTGGGGALEGFWARLVGAASGFAIAGVFLEGHLLDRLPKTIVP